MTTKLKLYIYICTNTYIKQINSEYVRKDNDRAQIPLLQVVTGRLTPTRSVVEKNLIT